MNIEARKERLDRAARAAGRAGAVWHGAMGEACPRCGVEVPEGYLLALCEPDVSGCLRCLEHGAHMALNGLDHLPDDLAGAGCQTDAMRQVADGFRAQIRAAERGREAPSRKQAQSRWAAQSGWEFTADWEPPGAETARGGEKLSRWPEKGSRAIPKPDPNRGDFRRRARKPPRPRTPPGPADILGVEGNPTRDEIIAAFRRQALIHHPDYGGSADAFRELIEARDALLGDG